MRLNELNVIGLAIQLKYVPEKYRKMKLIGRGATSLVVQDPDHDDKVIMLTRDTIKTEWLQQSGMGEYIETIDMYHPDSDIREKEVTVLRCDKLYPLSAENKKIVRKLIKLFDQDRWATLYDKYKSSNGQLAMRFAQKLEMEFTNQKSCIEFFNFIMNYDDSQYIFDLLMRNFMQNSDGEIIANDLIVDSEVLNALRNRRNSNSRY